MGEVDEVADPLHGLTVGAEPDPVPRPGAGEHLEHLVPEIEPDLEPVSILPNEELFGGAVAAQRFPAGAVDEEGLDPGRCLDAVDGFEFLLKSAEKRRRRAHCHSSVPEVAMTPRSSSRTRSRALPVRTYRS